MLFPDGIEVSSGQLKRYNESIIDPKCLLKLKRHPFVLITIYLFQATSYFLGASLPKLKQVISKGCLGSHSRHTITNIEFSLVIIKLFEIAAY